MKKSNISMNFIMILLVIIFSICMLSRMASSNGSTLLSKIYKKESNSQISTEAYQETTEEMIEETSANAIPDAVVEYAEVETREDDLKELKSKLDALAENMQETTEPETTYHVDSQAKLDRIWEIENSSYYEYHDYTNLYDYGDALYVSTIYDSIPLRTAPSMGAGVITQMPLYGDVMYLEDAGTDFFKVSYNGMVGYALANDFCYTDARSVDIFTGQTLRVINAKQSITLRTAPYTSASEILQIPLGATVDYIETRGDFHLVRYNGEIGYALASYLAFN